jgi:Spy/CpxP family protein refolding chaperone
MHLDGGMHIQRTSIAVRRGTAAFALMLALATYGCAGSNTAPAVAPDEATNDEAAADLMEHDSHHHYGGLPMLVAMSLETLGVDPGQQLAVNDIRADLYRRMQPARAAEQTLLHALADGVAIGLIDASRVDDALDRLASANNGLSEAVAADLCDLHSILKPEQRAAVVDKVEAHWMLWQRANGEGPSETLRRSRLDGLTKELGLTPSQVEKVRAGLEATREGSRPMAFQEVEARVQAFESFRGYSFDPSPLASDAPSSHLASWGAARMAQFFEALNPVLTAEQRTKLADRLREHAKHTEERPS